MKQLFLLILLMSIHTVDAQDTTRSKVQVKLGLFYNSNLNYYGRTDSLRSAATFLQLELWLSKGFYINATPIVVHNATQRLAYAGTTATVGYQHLTERWLSNVYMLKPFYQEQSDLAQSVLKLGSGISVTRFTKLVNVTLGGDLNWSGNVAFGATAGLDHIFPIASGKRGTLVIDPSFYAYGGTQRFTETEKKSRGLVPPRPVTSEEESGRRFTLLAYEASLPLVFVKGKAIILATPAYVSPQNLVQVAGRPDLSENGKSTFSLTIGMKYTF